MFSHTASEAMYEYLGLCLHARVVEILTSERFFKGLILVIFALMFFLTTAQFFSRYLPSAIINSKRVALSRYFKIIFCLFLGISLLKVGASTSAQNFKREFA